MSEISIKDNEYNVTFKGRWQNIKYTTEGTPYVTKYGERMPLDWFMRTEHFEVEGYTVHAMHFTSQFGGFGIEIGEGGDRARLIEHYC